MLCRSEELKRPLQRLPLHDEVDGIAATHGQREDLETVDQLPALNVGHENLPRMSVTEWRANPVIKHLIELSGEGWAHDE